MRSGMDPLTIITTAATIVGTAITLSKNLYDTVEALKDAPSDVRALFSTVDSVKSAVSRLVGFMNNEDNCAWPDQWLEDVMNDVEAIGEELKEVERLVEDWRNDGKQVKGKESKVKDTWRSWKWQFKAEDVQRCTKRLRQAKEDLGLQINVIQMSTTAQMSQDVIEVKGIVGTIKAELSGQALGYDNHKFNAELHGFANQISDLKDTVLALVKQQTEKSSTINSNHQDNSSPKFTVDESQRMADKTANMFLDCRSSLESFGSESSGSILSPLSALNRQAFQQNQYISDIRLEAKENPINIASLGLKLADMQRKYDELLIHWDNAMKHGEYLQNELDRHVARNFAGQVEDGTLKNFVSPLDEKREEIESREAVIDVLKAQNEALQDMISERVTIEGYRDEALNARDLGKQLLNANEMVNRQQEKIDLLKWRLEGEQSSLREQLKVNKILDGEVKLLKQMAEDKRHRKKRSWLLPPNSWKYDDRRQSSLSSSQACQPNSSSYTPTTPPSSSTSNKTSFWRKSHGRRLLDRAQFGETAGKGSQSAGQSVLNPLRSNSDHYESQV